MRAWFDRLANRGMVLFVSAIVLTVITVSLANMAISRQELERQTRSQVSTVARMVAYELDRKLIERFGVLAEAADAMKMDAVSFHQFSGLIMERQRPLSHLFETLYLLDEDGIVLQSYPELAGLRGTDLSGRPYFRETVEQLTPKISEPFSSYIRKLPTVVMTAPVFDHNGSFVGMVAGSIVLTSNNFLSEVTSTGIGQDGYISVVTRSGLIVVQKGYQGEIRAVSSENSADLSGMEGFEGVTGAFPALAGQRWWQSSS